jgi:Tfp pilus assembly protein PilX
VNGYLTQTAEAAFDEPGWYPWVPVGLQNQEGETSLVVQMGQCDPAAQQARLYSAMELDLYYSLSADQAPPQFTVVDGLYNPATGRVNLKVGATDPSGVQRAMATVTRGGDEWGTVELTFDASMHKWTGSFPGDTSSRYFVQVVDGAGNAANTTNKGRYYAPAVDPTPTASVYLPVVLRQ